MGVFNRRKFIKGGVATIAAAGAALKSTAPSSMAATKAAGKTRNIIFMISDGMSSGTLSIADQFIRWRDNRSSHWLSLYDRDDLSRGLMETASANNIVTDSAAAASAFGCGVRVNNGSLNIGPDGTTHEPILVTARRAGKSTGLVTTATVTHATPAGFAANVRSRGDERQIAEQYQQREIDVILGGGASILRRDPDLVPSFQAKNYAFAENAGQMRKAAQDRDQLLGLFSSGHVPYEIDRLNDEDLLENVPTLAEMTEAALKILNRNEEGFVLMIEGARVDHAAHANDAAGLIYDQIAFDDSIGVVKEFAENVPETLVVVTTDHGNANPSLNSGDRGGRTAFRYLSASKGTIGHIIRQLNGQSSIEQIKSVVKTISDIDLSDRHAEIFKLRLQERLDVPYGNLSTTSSVLGAILANYNHISWSSRVHSSDHVELAAFGPGSEGVKAFSRNTELHGLMAATL